MSNDDNLSQQYVGEIDVPQSTIWCRGDYAELEKLVNSYKMLKVS
ncbi:hypothetical protein A3Q56_04079 [Intoshia linei]|uniref:Uncharacterized protein n=1 Tax=Intoshia linei TaxID=1819745 RepID=A0A177B1R0_9BILA|nr:hypothetical protein A3Q56_04079 [Intoshia linei]